MDLYPSFCREYISLTGTISVE